MSQIEEIATVRQVKLIPERVSKTTDEEKLKASLEHRQGRELKTNEIGTAEHRPKKGLIYDAPLGLKF